ncbi:hypothetical protein DFH28DRAFT_937484 [Melampsora americana]|nr:hypothetical protein DFH28DRAFT_937484 [Melampsora americana]
MPNLHLTIIIFMSLTAKTICFLNGEYMGSKTTVTNDKFDPLSKNVQFDSGFQIRALAQERSYINPHSYSTPSLGPQSKVKMLQNSDHLEGIGGSRGKRKILLIEDTPNYQGYPSESGHKSTKHQKFVDRENHSIPNQGIRIHADKSWDAFASNLPLNLFSTDEDQMQLKNFPGLNKGSSKILSTHEKEHTIYKPEGFQITIPSSSRDTRGKYQSQSKENDKLQRYTFINSGETVLLSSKKVLKIRDSWHVIAPHQEIVSQLRRIGFELAIQAGLHLEGEKIHPWFQNLRREMQDQISSVSEHPKGSVDINLTILKTYRHLMMGFLASLHLIHSGSAENLDGLTLDGWNFMLGYLEGWKQSNWNEALHLDIDTAHCMGIYTSIQTLSYVINLKKTSRVSMCILWSLCNIWYKASTYRNKVKLENLQGFIEAIHYSLAKANLFPKWEVEPSHISTTLQLGSSSLPQKIESFKQMKSSMVELSRGNAHTLDHCKRVVSLSKGVGHKVVWELLNEGMIQILYYPETTQIQQNSAVLINGFQFLKELLQDWGENALERACDMEFRWVTNLDACKDLSGALLGYLLKLSPGTGSKVASSLFWLLWKGWDEWEGSKSMPKLGIKTHNELMTAIGKVLSI